MESLHPRSIGEVLSDAAALLRGRLRPFFAVALPFSAAEMALREGGHGFFSSSLRAILQGAETGDVDLGGIAPALAAGTSLYLAWLVVSQLLSTAVVRMTADALDGGAPAPRAGLAAIARRGPAVVLTLLIWLLVLGAAVAAPFAAVVGAAIAELWPVVIIAGVIAVPLAAVAAVLLLLRFAVWLPVVVLEGAAGVTALGRSGRVMASAGEPLVEGPKFRLSVLLLVYFAVAFTLQSLFVLPRLVLGVADGGVLGGVPPLVSLPLPLMVPLGFFEVLTNAVVVPFASIMLTLFYRDALAAREGSDLA